MTVTRSSVIAVQDPRQFVDWYFLLKASPFLTVPLIRMGVSANATTVIWGVLNVATALLVYRAICGAVALVPVIFALFALTEILDTSDGEIARYTGTSSPIGGKLLDGVCHKATEFALAAAYICGAATISGAPAILFIALALLAGEGMLAFCYERRLLIIRIHLQSREKAGGKASALTYSQGARWIDLPAKHKVRTLTGLVSYKSIYLAILLAAWSPLVFVWALAALAAYKHASWVRMVARMLRSATPAPVA